VSFPGWHLRAVPDRPPLEVLGLADGWYVYRYMPRGPTCLARCTTLEAAYAACRLFGAPAS
jgi:hypothetical protein